MAIRFGSAVLSQNDEQCLLGIGRIANELATNIRRPARVCVGKLAVCVGTDETINCYTTDGMAFAAQFTIDRAGAVLWIGHNEKIREIIVTIEKFYAILLAVKNKSVGASFQHSCSICCWESHGRMQDS